MLEPPAFGGFICDLARRLGESEADTYATAIALQLLYPIGLRGRGQVSIHALYEGRLCAGPRQ